MLMTLEEMKYKMEIQIQKANNKASIEMIRIQNEAREIEIKIDRRNKKIDEILTNN